MYIRSPPFGIATAGPRLRQPPPDQCWSGGWRRSLRTSSWSTSRCTGPFVVRRRSSVLVGALLALVCFGFESSLVGFRFLGRDFAQRASLFLLGFTLAAQLVFTRYG